jgi:hypothetical protein
MRKTVRFISPPLGLIYFFNGIRAYFPLISSPVSMMVSFLTFGRLPFKLNQYKLRAIRRQQQGHLIID